MKITVNTIKSKLRKQQVINEILASAKDCGERGINNFIYEFVAGERNSFPGCDINIAVSDASQGSVKCGYRCDHGNYIKFYIG